MNQIDFLVLIAVIGCLLAVGLFGRRKSETTHGYFLAGRELKWWQIGFSLFATNFSAAAIIGLTGAAYLTGIAIYNYEWVGIIAMVVFALVLASALRRSHVFTISQYLEERYGQIIKIAYSAFIIFLIIFIDMAAALYAGGMLLKEVFPFLSVNVIIFIIMLMVGAYSVLGGMSAIARTDVIQTLVIAVGAVLVSWFTFEAVGGWNAFLNQAPEGALSLIRPADDRAVPWTGLLTGVPILCAYFWLTNQNMVQWVLSARSESDARRGLMMAGFMKIAVLFIIVLPGVAAVSLFPGLSQPDRIYPTLLFELLPAGILGLVLAGFVAAIMASVDSTLHAASTIITMDFINRGGRELTSRQLVWAGRMITMIIICISAVWAPAIGNFGTLFEYVQGLLSYAVAPFVIVYLGGWFWDKANATGAKLALVFGIATAVSLGLFQQFALIDLHYLHVPLPVATVSLVGLVLGSVMFRKRVLPVPDDRLLVRNFGGLTLADLGMAVALTLLVIAQVVIFW